MPLTNKGEKILSEMKQQYGGEKGEEVFYASRNKGTISGVDAVINWGWGYGPTVPPGKPAEKQTPETGGSGK